MGLNKQITELESEAQDLQVQLTDFQFLQAEKEAADTDRARLNKEITALNQAIES